MDAPFLLLLIIAILILAIELTRMTGYRPRVRPMPVIEAFKEAVARAAETGRPVHLTSGLGGISDPGTFAFWTVLGHVSRLAARYGAPLLQTNSNVYVQAINETIIRDAYAAAGHSQNFDPSSVRYLSPWQFGYATALLGIFQRERPAANIMIGSFGAEALLLAEGGAQAGAMQIGGTTDMEQLPFFLATCDYTLLGEEIFAVGAQLSQDPVALGSIVGQDLVKVILLLWVGVGIIVKTFYVH